MDPGLSVGKGESFGSGRVSTYDFVKISKKKKENRSEEGAGPFLHCLYTCPWDPLLKCINIIVTLRLLTKFIRKSMEFPTD